jgi:hypothetical protein
VGAAYLALPAVARLARRIVAVEVDDAEWKRLAALREHRLILTPNHPSASDPLIAFWIGRRLRRCFSILACRELFESPYGGLLQRLGCYSVTRGALDRSALATTLSLLADQDRQLVIFPEGEIYGHNDLLLPFQSGVVQMGFMALDRMAKAGKEPRLPVVPVVVKYLHAENPREMIRAGLGRLEAALGLAGDEGSDYLRLRRVGEAVLSMVEREYHLSPPPEATPAARLDAARRRILERVAREIDVPCPGGSFAEGLHTLLHRLHEWEGEFDQSDAPYARRIECRRSAAATPLYQELWRLQNVIALSDGYVAAKMTGERFVEVLNRIEVEVTGRPRTVPRSRALVRIAEPLDLGERLDHYRQAKRAAIAAATGELEARMRALLEEMQDLGTPLDG